MEKLKPCPFCGGEEIHTYPPTCHENEEYDPNDRLFPIAKCGGCFAEAWGDNNDHTADSRSAVKRWNARTPTTLGED